MSRGWEVNKRMFRQTGTGPDGAVAMSSANGFVGTGIASRAFKYQNG